MRLGLGGRYPTPVERHEPLGLWVKRDDLSHPVYGGNKVRKLEHILAEAKARGATRLITAGAAGSHHVLATAILGKRAGFEVEAVLAPQPESAHAIRNLRAGLAHGLTAIPVRNWGLVATTTAMRQGKDSYSIMVGGSNVAGTVAYVDVVRELTAQVRSGEMPEPDVVVVTLGSGGTAGGIAAGLEIEGLKSKVMAVCVADPGRVLEWMSRGLAWEAARASGKPVSMNAIAKRMTVDHKWRGKGYAIPTPEGEIAMARARGCGIKVEPTYTAKTLACALSLTEKYKTVLFWNTYSAVEPSIDDAPELSPELLSLFRR
jgi:1-aminocyclopropane-1-carboxylate deaminase/D-cysteine desulfhydrase-like pyridoxal-dependent ACC family enzyme